MGFLRGTGWYLQMKQKFLIALQAAESLLKALKYRLSKQLACYNLTLTYRMLGDRESAEKYQKLYEENGGDIHELEETYSCYLNE